MNITGYWLSRNGRDISRFWVLGFFSSAEPELRLFPTYCYQYGDCDFNFEIVNSNSRLYNKLYFRYKSKEIINTDDDLSTDSDEEKPLKPKLVILKCYNDRFNNECRKNLNVK